jgi:RNA polymerase sigma factor (sigma-70 family)
MCSRIKPSSIYQVMMNPVTLTHLSRADRLSALYQENMSVAIRIAFAMTGQRSLAEDLAQDAFIKAASRLSLLRSENAFSSYLHRTLVNRVAMHYRRQALERLVVQRGYSQALQTDHGDLIAERGRIHELLLELPTRQRAAVVMHFIADFSFEEIGKSLNCPAGTARSLSSRGITALKKGLNEDDD